MSAANSGPRPAVVDTALSIPQWPALPSQTTAASTPRGSRHIVQPVIVFGKCKSNCTSYIYITGAILLICLGTGVTVLPYCYNLGSEVPSSRHPPGGLIHLWLVGVMLIGFGIMVGVNTVFYMKSRAGITIISVDLTAQHQQLSEQNSQAAINAVDLNCDSWDDTMPRNVSNLTFPPSYDAVVANTTSQSNSNTWLLHPECRREPPSYIRDPDYQDPLTYRDQECQDPPPSYEEAMLLYNPAHGSGGLIGQSDHIQEPSTESSDSHLNNQNSQHDSKDVP